MNVPRLPSDVHVGMQAAQSEDLYRVKRDRALAFINECPNALEERNRMVGADRC